MDPNANLKEQQELAAVLLECQYEAWADVEVGALRLAELVQALDEWIKKGGALPAAWEQS